MEEEQRPVYQHTGSVIGGAEIPPQSNLRPSSRGQQSRPPVQDRKGKDHRAEGTGKVIRKGRGTQEGSPHDGEKDSSSRRGATSQSQGDNKVITSGSKKDPPAAHSGGTKNENADAERGKIRRRAPKFNPGLTAPVAVASTPGETPTPRAQSSSSSKPPQTSKQKHNRPGKSSRSQPDDLTSTLIKALSTRPYPDCSICFSAIHPAQPTWSCSPSIPQVPGDGATIPQYCWNTFHLNCIKSWAEKSVKELEKAWQNRGESGKKGDWRCPGCQAKREVVPTGYWYASHRSKRTRILIYLFIFSIRCFCNSTPDPKPPRLATPHSCGGPCSRVRETGCGHACPLLCHPGPCPPCQVTLQLPCPCPRHQIVALRCGDDSLSGKGKGKEDSGARENVVSCGNVCGRMLDCGKHSCERACHTRACDACELMEDVKCYCGRSRKTVRCGEGKEVSCSIRNPEVENWIGRFQCEHTCDRYVPLFFIFTFHDVCCISP